ncbi:MAG: hypothetical protein BWY76_00659 [bacterium ADurb.Bin429]|nr:MAG: hypothetical protein BWY76_00659 [bacterium ADurb.Bin429]
MREMRVTLRLRSGHITPFQADTLFGHLCWALAERDGADAVAAFLAAYQERPPLLVSDGFPLLDGRVYLPMPALSWPSFLHLAARFHVGEDAASRPRRRLLAGALKRVAKTPFVTAQALLPLLHEGLSAMRLVERIFTLAWCPKALVPRTETGCACTHWEACPALNPEVPETAACQQASYPTAKRDVVMHNTVNRLTSGAEAPFQVEERHLDHDIAFFVTLDETQFSADRLRMCLKYLVDTGYGKDRSTGKGAITDSSLDTHALPVPDGANAFLSLSSAYAPCAGELSNQAWYQVHVKYGKLGGGLATTSNPFKKPVLMLRAGAVITGTPDRTYGGLIPHIHWERDEIVQYGYAYPLWMRLEDDDA